MASPNLQWIVEQQECLHGSLQQIMSITYCVKNPSPLFSFTPLQKTNGQHSLMFGWGVNYHPLSIWTATSDNSPVRPPTQQSLPGLFCWYHLLMQGHWYHNLIYAWNTIKIFQDKDNVISSPCLVFQGLLFTNIRQLHWQFLSKAQQSLC